jgi:hypothetical protein
VGTADESPARRAAVLWLSGSVAVLMFAVCLGLAIWVFVNGPESYRERLIILKDWLMWGSVFHLASAAIWLRENERGKEPSPAT